LTGTYEARIPAWADTIHPLGRRPRMQTRQLALFQRHDGGFTLTWHAPRQEFLAAARALAQRDPSRYDAWLDRMMRDPKRPMPLDVASEYDWLARVASVGPVLRGIDEILPLKRCVDGWFLLWGPGHRDGPPDFEGGMKGTRDLEFWLARDKDGSINLKTREYHTVVLTKESQYTPDLGIHLGSAERLTQWPVAPAQDLSPIRPEELPARTRPARPAPKCQIIGDPEALFLQRLKANLPPKVQLENYSASIYQGRMRPDGVCDPTPYIVTVSGPAAGIAKVEEHLRADRFIRQVDSQDSHDMGDGRLMVKFRMMAAP
jgi:hypothetical protein